MAGANVPGLENNPQQYSTNVPGMALPNRREWGEEGRAYEGLGSEVGQAAHAGYQIYDEVQRQYDISSAADEHLQATIGHKKMMDDLVNSSPDGFMHDTQTNEIIKDKANNPRTIAHEYWDRASQDFEERQHKLTDRGAAIFREEMKQTIGRNTISLQGEGATIQHKASLDLINDSVKAHSLENDVKPFPSYYQSTRDGVPILRGSLSQVFQNLDDIDKKINQHGPLASGAPGLFPASQVNDLAKASKNTLAKNYIDSVVTNIFENDTARRRKGSLSLSATDQVHGAIDFLDGKDPESLERQAKNLSTIHSSLTSEQIDKEKLRLFGALIDAKKVDKSEFQRNFDNTLDLAKRGKWGDNPHAFFGSDEIKSLEKAATAINLPPEEKALKMREMFKAGAAASYSGRDFDLGSESYQNARIESGAAHWAQAADQYYAGIGAKLLPGEPEALRADMVKDAHEKQVADRKKFVDDPADFSSKLASGYSPSGMAFRSAKMHAVADKQNHDPSLNFLINPSIGGKSPIDVGFETMAPIYARGELGGEVVPFPKSTYKEWAHRIDKGHYTGEDIEKMFTGLEQNPHGRVVMDQLVRVGGLDKAYQEAHWLQNPMAKIDAFNNIRSKGAAAKALAKEGPEHSIDKQRAIAMNVPEVREQLDFLNRFHGAASQGAAEAKDRLLTTWMSARASSFAVSHDSDAAVKTANERVLGKMAPILDVVDRHSFLGTGWFGRAASKVQLARPGDQYSDSDKAKIIDGLYKNQQEAAVASHKIAPATIRQGEYDFNKKLTPKWVSEHPFIWHPVQSDKGPAYRLMYQGMTADASPTGSGYDLEQFREGESGSRQFKEVLESDLLKGK